MPEGDTIHTLARALGPALEGQVLERVWLRNGGATELRGRRVERVFAVGKHLVITVEEEGLRPDALRVHLGLPGSWRLGPADPEARWRTDVVVARLGTAHHEALCFRAPTVELGRLDRMWATGALSRLGPDLLGPRPDLDAIADRARLPRPVGDVLLDQSVACGIGNVYRSEVCFFVGVNPRRRADHLSDEVRRGLYAQARAWMLDNLGPWRRLTTGPPPRPPSHGSRTWVYARGGRPCLRCGARVARGRQGAPSRVTFWCPACQPFASPPPVPSWRGSAGSAEPSG